jgi:hypothetical protein
MDRQPHERVRNKTAKGTGEGHESQPVRRHAEGRATGETRGTGAGKAWGLGDA